MTRDQAYIHRAQQSQYGEKDIDDKFFIIKILRENYGLYGLTGEIVMIDEQHARCPDILIKARVIPIVIELDGQIHGDGDQVTKRTRDELRDSDYNKAGVQLIIINKSVTKGYQKDLVMETFDNEGLAQI